MGPGFPCRKARSYGDPPRTAAIMFAPLTISKVTLNNFIASSWRRKVRLQKESVRTLIRRKYKLATVASVSRGKRGPRVSNEDPKDELERLRKENGALKKSASSGFRMKVSEKGAVSIYGMGRFPVTLYKEQWLKLLDMSGEIRAFIADNEAKLKTKD